ncbi:hypothetical protein AOZ06_42185 [Kibdelosporangium phytohabitans]|uniref:DUF3040 domain-containing protein n=1 Tax=Kibdelosporangium phytohabitans TaxID=860235 RepID=A0A0N9I203_9PSEU|nr:hypothetical protein AOZ06_42185 [Kibdelosporangium phytohabitans]
MIEEWFEQDDPQLARTMRTGPVKHKSAAPQVIMLVAAGSLGLLGLITGTFMLIFSAMLAAVAGGCMIAARRKDNV